MPFSSASVEEGGGITVAVADFRVVKVNGRCLQGVDRVRIVSEPDWPLEVRIRTQDELMYRIFADSVTCSLECDELDCHQIIEVKVNPARIWVRDERWELVREGGFQSAG